MTRIPLVLSLLLLHLLLLETHTVTASQLYAIQASYLGDQCSGTPYAVTVYMDDNCTISHCNSYDLSNGTRTVNANMMTTDCSANYNELLQVVRSKFRSTPYLIQTLNSDDKCSELSMAFAYPAMDACVGAYNETDALYAVTSLNPNGSASLTLYSERTCFAKDQYMNLFVTSTSLANHECTVDYFRWYSSNDAKTSNENASIAHHRTPTRRLKMAAIIGIATGGVGLVVVLIVALMVRKRRNKARQMEKYEHYDSTMTPTTIDSFEAVLRGQTGLWYDDVITANRIPRDKVLRERLISRGSFGEVYAGRFNGERVAIKVLLPAMKGIIPHVNDFLAEAKMTAGLDHPHIVTFIGVAWDSLADICVVFEYMNGGELRTLLSNFEKEQHPVGFTRQKASIALQVCHALTYLHSMSPPILHRDLKSRNVLLNLEMTAKLSDFGISRQRLDQTMTAGVGTSLWMAPEVMLGERYDDKADVFSFGVVLSELDVHTLPYARAKKEGMDSKGREIPDSILLQKVALGTITVEFSDVSPTAMIELGRACTSVYPTERPTAAEALYKLQLILAAKDSSAL